jgi:hypothetical protein
MTMPRRGTRQIKVNGVPYRFRVRALKPSIGPRLRVLIEDETSPGHILTVEFAERRCSTVGPEEISAFIQFARNAGWVRAMRSFILADTAVDEALVAIGR